MVAYVITPPAVAYYYTDMEKADPILGFNMRDPNNVAYSIYNKSFAKFQKFRGFSLLMDAALNSQAGDTFTYYIDNLTKGAQAYFSTFTMPVTNSTRIRIYITEAEMAKLDEGKIECYGSLDSPSTNSVYVINSTFLELRKP